MYKAHWSVQSDVMMFDDIICLGTETSINNCMVSHFTRASSCGYISVAGITCQGNNTCYVECMYIFLSL